MGSNRGFVKGCHIMCHQEEVPPHPTHPPAGRADASCLMSVPHPSSSFTGSKATPCVMWSYRGRGGAVFTTLSSRRTSWSRLYFCNADQMSQCTSFVLSGRAEPGHRKRSECAERTSDHVSRCWRASAKPVATPAATVQTRSLQGRGSSSTAVNTDAQRRV